MIYKIIAGSLMTNCYLVSDKNNNCIIVDSGDEAGKIIETIEEFKLNPVKIIATHGHFDHIMAVNKLKIKYKIPFYSHKKDEFLIKELSQQIKFFLGHDVKDNIKVDGYLDEKKEIFGLKIILTPGHTPGSVCLYNKSENYLISGDLLFENGIGRTDFSYSNEEKHMKSLKRIFTLPNNTIVYPGHGNETTIEREKQV